jgi:hypothetical protein
MRPADRRFDMTCLIYRFEDLWAYIFYVLQDEVVLQCDYNL